EVSKYSSSSLYLITSLGILLLITFFLYRPVIEHRFTNWDDPTYVLENEHVKEFNLNTCIYFFSHPSASNYHPLTMISLSLDYQLATEKGKSSTLVSIDPAPFHATSLILFLIDVILVFIFIYLLTGRKILIAFVTALLFAIHPMHVESVAWVSERKDVLYGLFFLAGLITYVRFLQTSRWSFYLLTVFLFILSILSKPAAVVFPLVLFVIDYYYRRKLTWKTTMEKVPMLLLSIVAGLVTYLIQSENAVADFSTFTIFQRILFASYGFMMYLARLLIPFQLSAFYPYPVLSPTGYLPMIFYFSPLIVLAFTALVILSIRYTRVVLFGFLFYLFSVILVLQFISVGSAIMADRYAFIPCIGLFFVVGYYVNYCIATKQKNLRFLQIIVPAVVAVYTVVLIIVTSGLIKIWENTETLWTDVISKYPTVEVAYKNRGIYYGKQDRTEEALRDYKVLVQFNTRDAKIYSNLGNIYALKGDVPEALKAYDKAIGLDTTSPEAYMNRGITHARNRNFEPALRDLRKAEELNPVSMEILINKAYLLLDMGKTEEALEQYNRLIRLDPRNDDFYLRKGLCLFHLGNHPAAKDEFNRCLNLNPRNAAAVFNLSVIYSAERKYPEALEYAQRAQSLGFQVDPGCLEKLKNRR
ncbi:MAG: tetratricopeptide repeat protein, partial [Bacteroidia bacterium]|nr:tetratricopeptide repeat protein [Bacteroidia bacterium]